MSRQYNWNELKIEFMTGDYKNLKEFSKEKGLPYNSNFRRITKGWISERDANMAQMYSQITESKMNEKVKQFMGLKETFDETGEELFYLIDDFIKNKDYSKFPIKQGTDGVDVVEVSYIKINEINKAVNSLNKLYKILSKTYPTLSKLHAQS